MLVIPMRVTSCEAGAIVVEEPLSEPVLFEDAQLIISIDKVEMAESYSTSKRALSFRWGYKRAHRS